MLKIYKFYYFYSIYRLSDDVISISDIVHHL